MELAQDAFAKTNRDFPEFSHDEKVGKCAKFALVHSINNLLTFPWICDKVRKNELSLHSWYFNIDSGIIEEFDAQKEEFFDLKIEQ